MKDEEEAKKVHHIRSLFKPARLFKNHHLHFVSEEMRKDAFVNFPPQLQSSSSLLHMRTYGLSILQFFTHLGRHTKRMRLDVSRQNSSILLIMSPIPCFQVMVTSGAAFLLSWYKACFNVFMESWSAPHTMVINSSFHNVRIKPKLLL